MKNQQPASAEYVPMSMLKKPATPLETVEASLHVECVGDLVHVVFQGFAKKSGYRACVTMHNDVWREFCQRQLAVPPPLPKGGQA